MDPLPVGLGNRFAQEIFDGFDVVIGFLFESFDSLEILFRKIATFFSKIFGQIGVERKKFFISEKDKPLYFDFDTIFHQPKLGKNFGDFGGFLSVSAVEGGEGKVHFWADYKNFWANGKFGANTKEQPLEK